MTLKTINPTTEEIIAEYDIISKEKIFEAVKKSKTAFADWKKDIKKRTHFIHIFAQELRKNK
ncbi:MAG TPA: aldehyde dehydrogenase family protein, partial [Candidatus Nitrosotenuis sp.]|nr:aldehyde dehydrogenase family protein [Candidatus Nitrosotenuis sp.]